MADDLHKFSIDVAVGVLDEMKAYTIPGLTSEFSAVFGDREINRVWREGVSYYVDELCDFLQTWVDVKNYDGNNPDTVIHTVTDPVVDQNTRVGKYRLVSVRPEIVKVKGVEVLVIVETLRLGYTETLVSNSQLIWDEARIVQFDTFPKGDDSTMDFGDVEGEFLVLEFRNVDATKIKAVEKEIRDLSSTAFAPKIFTGEWGTGWNIMYARGLHDIDDDNAGVVRVLIGKPQFDMQGFQFYGTGDAETTLYHKKVPRQIVKALTDTYKVTGYTVTLGEAADGVIDVVCRKTDYTGESISNIVTSADCAHTTTTSITVGVNRTSAAAIVIPATIPAGYKYGLNTRYRGQGRWDVIQTLRVASYTSIDRHVAESSEGELGYRTRHDGVTDEAAEVGTLPSSATGRSVRIKRSQDADCSETIDVHERYPQSMTSNSWRKTHGDTEARIRTDNATSALEEPTPSQNEILERISIKTGVLGNWNNLTNSKTMVPDEATGVMGDAGMTTTFAVRKFWTTVGSIGTVLPGFRHSIRNQPTGLGSYDQQERLDQVHELSVEEIVYATRYGDATVKTVDNGSWDELAADAAACTTSTVNSLSPRKTSWGLYNWTLTKRPYEDDGTGGGPNIWADEESAFLKEAVMSVSSGDTLKVRYNLWVRSVKRTGYFSTATNFIEGAHPRSTVKGTFLRFEAVRWWWGGTTEWVQKIDNKNKAEAFEPDPDHPSVGP